MKNIIHLSDKLVENTIYFNTEESNEIIKLCNNGDIFVKGKLIENDKEVVEAMREFLNLKK